MLRIMASRARIAARLRQALGSLGLGLLVLRLDQA